MRFSVRVRRAAAATPVLGLAGSGSLHTAVLEAASPATYTVDYAKAWR
ncbi:hypothetical protein [Nocardioides immobilis]|nr:hypothetical protein [Nocardioides immobilis]